MKGVSISVTIDNDLFEALSKIAEQDTGFDKKRIEKNHDDIMTLPLLGDIHATVMIYRGEK